MASLTQRLTIEEMQKIAKSHNGKCLSKKYINTYTKLKWQCAEGHTWMAIPQNVKYAGHWCPKCPKSFTLTIDEMNKVAKKHNGKCLSTTYINNQIKLKWQCAEGHKWFGKYSHIQQGSWCPKCKPNFPLNIKTFNKIAKDRNGKCLSKKYVNAYTKLKWQCAEGHTWMAVPTSIKQNSWCPYCTKNYSEELCRTTFEQIFKKKFKKTRPKWLINKRNNQMELDGYCKGLNIAFEYQGIQHFKESYFVNKKQLKTRKEDDKLKSKLCKNNGVNLFILTYKNDIIELPKIIKKKSKLINLKISKFNFDKKIDFNKVYKHKTNIEEMQKLAKKHNGKCLSNKYVNNSTKLEWQCVEGHIWMATPTNVKNNGHWCRKCNNTELLTIEDMQKIAKKYDGKCLSKKYINNSTKLKWKCVKGHTWMSTPSSIRNLKTWCPTCSKNKKLTIEEMGKLAKRKKGKCLSKKYLGAHKKLKWQCSENHTWMTTPNHIKHSKTWCPKCYENS